MNTNNISIHRNGKKAWAVGIKGGTEEQVRQEFWAWANHGATAIPDANWISPNFCYFWTTPVKLRSAMESRILIKLLNSDECAEYKGVKQGVWPVVEAKLNAAWDAVNNFVPEFKLPRAKEVYVYREASHHDMYACREDNESTDYEPAENR